jgi:alpha/beta hydrolase family protein
VGEGLIQSYHEATVNASMTFRDICKPRHERVQIDGLELFYRHAGDPGTPTLLLLHGFPSSSHMFRHVISPLAEVAHVVAPDMPGFGFSSAPERVRGIIVQNGNAHDSGMGPQWDSTRQFRADPTPERRNVEAQFSLFTDYANHVKRFGELDRCEIHVFDSAHMLLETHPAECAELMARFVVDN